jgi:class 3 adenylate cyclase
VLHARDNPFIPARHGRYIAEHIDGAKYVEFEGQGVAFDDGGMATVIDEIARFITGERAPIAVDRVLTTVLFTDIVASTEQLVALGDERWRDLLDAHDRAVRAEFRRFSGREIKTTGDGFCACFDGPSRAVQCAKAIIAAVRGAGVEVRAGVHTGECELRDNDLAGIAVHIAARVAAVAGAGEVWVSNIVRELVKGSGIEFLDTGEHSLKGVPDTWRLFSVRN